MFDLCSKICTALKPQCGINFVRKIFRILEKFLKYNLWKHKNNSIEQYIRETNRNNKQLTSKKYAAQTSDFGCNEQQLTSILTQSDRSNRKCLILEKLSPEKITMWEWWISRSTSAAVRRLSPKTVFHCENSRLDVIMRLFRS
jgi:hypothetical protein